ncbi:MAG: PD40 domain-containing protein [Verrucomicrobiales bacterium]|nr:PD40 domain-containing protein [Verrucomicrobiales bacterium]
MKRRTFLSLAAASTCAALTACRSSSPTSHRRRKERLFFTSGGKTFLIHDDGTGLRPLELERPQQVTWQPAGFLADGRVVMLSMEARRDGPGRPFDEYYHQTPTHVWAYDLDRDVLTELATKDRVAPFYTPQLVLADGRILMQVIRKRPGQILNMNLDGTDAREFTGIDEGLPYGLSLSPDGKRVAFHLAGRDGYQIWTSDTLGGNRVRIAAQPGHLYFGPSWSPDGAWLVYQDCHAPTDPGHDWSDVCIGRPDGSEHRVLTQGQAMWFAATYGRPGNRGGGSNVPAWTRDGRILFPRRIPGSRVPWEYQANRPDTDHFNRDYKPETAAGGTFVCQLDPRDGSHQALTPVEPGQWDFRGTASPGGNLIAFCRAKTGDTPGLWVMESNGSSPRLLTRGPNDQGIDHPRWLPSA